MSAHTPPPVDLSMLLNQSGYALANRLAVALQEAGVTVREYCVLAKAAGGDFTQGEIAEAAWLDKTTMVVAADALEARGLAERRPSPADRRARVIAVTVVGSTALAQADAIVQEVYDAVLGDVPAKQREAFLRTLDQLVAGPLAAPFHLEGQRSSRRRGQRSAS